MSHSSSFTRGSAKEFSDDAYHQIKRDFLWWWAMFMRGEQPQEPAMTIADFARIFQAMNFQIRNNAQEATINNAGVNTEPNPAATSEIRIVITCGRTANRVVLVRDHIDDDCGCNATGAGGGGEWEVTATSRSRQSLIEVGSDAFPPMAAEKARLVGAVMKYIGGIANGSITSTAHRNSICTTPEPSGDDTFNRRSDSFVKPRDGGCMARRRSIGGVAAGAPRNEINGRFQSLETLVGIVDMSPVPMPGVLQKPEKPEKIEVTPVTPAKEIQATARDSYAITGALRILKGVQVDVSRVLTMLVPSASTPKAEMKTLKIPQKKPSGMRTTNDARTKSSPNLTREPSEIKRPGVKPKTNPIVKSALPSPIGKTKPNSKYAHIKSTIPKPMSK